jgi:MerR family transcriptional regulator, copper efflux regulator
MPQLAPLIYLSLGGQFEADGKGSICPIIPLEFISDAKSVGFTIKEIGQIIDAWYNEKYSKNQKLEILDDKLISLEQKMKEIKAMKKQLLQFKDDVVNDRC